MALFDFLESVAKAAALRAAPVGRGAGQLELFDVGEARLWGFVEKKTSSEKNMSGGLGRTNRGSHRRGILKGVGLSWWRSTWFHVARGGSFRSKASPRSAGSVGLASALLCDFWGRATTDHCEVL
eukprot:scaffold75457_cov75-Phaeocystis_antarctica.AAC.3